MRYVGTAFLGVAALTLVLASMALNWRFWTAEAATPSKAAIYSACRSRSMLSRQGCNRKTRSPAFWMSYFTMDGRALASAAVRVRSMRSVPSLNWAGTNLLRVSPRPRKPPMSA